MSRLAAAALACFAHLTPQRAQEGSRRRNRSPMPLRHISHAHPPLPAASSRTRRPSSSLAPLPRLALLLPYLARRQRPGDRPTGPSVAAAQLGAGKRRWQIERKQSKRENLKGGKSLTRSALKSLLLLPMVPIKLWPANPDATCKRNKGGEKN